MKVLIIEDELPARAKLESMLKDLDPSIQVVATPGSVKETLKWLDENPEPELAFVDIQLSDDHSFEIFRQRPVSFPIVFTTAYDKHILESFEFNSIDYLLKPITEEKLKRALEKVRKLERHYFQNNFLKLLGASVPGQVKRIVAKKGSEFVSLDTAEIAYIFSEHKISFLKDIAGNQFILDKNLTELEADLDPKQFYRINRKYLASIKAIEKFKSDNGRIWVSLKPPVKEDVFVSKEEAPQFRKWVGQ